MAAALFSLAAAMASTACDDDTEAENGTGGSATGGSGGETSDGGGGSGGTGQGAGGSSSSSGQAGAGATGWAEGPPALNNDAACTTWESVTPDSGEAGHLYAARLTPPSYPFEVTEVQYELSGETPCDTSFAHRVEVFVDSAVAPAADPMVTQLDVAAAGANEQVRVVTEQLPTPITLNSGEHLFVAVELVTDATSCIAACGGATVNDRDYWSNATSAPYSWSALASFGVDAHARIGANGTAQ